MNKSVLVMGLLGLVVLFSGCVERRLTIHSEPEGAIVYLNDEEIGISPVTVDFNWYGDYQVQVIKPGYEILNEHRQLIAPGHDKFPNDFFAEVLWPGTIVDEYNWSFMLRPSIAVAPDHLISQAEKMRQRMAEEVQESHKKQAAEQLGEE